MHFICKALDQFSFLAVEMCRAQAMPKGMLMLESIGFALEEQGIALHQVEGDVYNEKGEKVTLVAAPVNLSASAKNGNEANPSPPPRSSSFTSTSTTSTCVECHPSLGIHRSVMSTNACPFTTPTTVLSAFPTSAGFTVTRH